MAAASPPRKEECRRCGTPDLAAVFYVNDQGPFCSDCFEPAIEAGHAASMVAVYDPEKERLLMPTGDEIILPRSGVAMMAFDRDASYWISRPVDEAHWALGYVASDDAGPHAGWMGGYAVFRGTVEECLADLDVRFVALRAALAPRDARRIVAEELTSAAIDGEMRVHDGNRPTIVSGILAALGMEGAK